LKLEHMEVAPCHEREQACNRHPDRKCQARSAATKSWREGQSSDAENSPKLETGRQAHQTAGQCGPASTRLTGSEQPENGDQQLGRMATIALLGQREEASADPEEGKIPRTPAEQRYRDGGDCGH